MASSDAKQYTLAREHIKCEGEPYQHQTTRINGIEFVRKDSVMEWISVRVSLPKPNENVIWYDSAFNEIFIYALNDPHKYDGDLTHWQPLPEAPK